MNILCVEDLDIIIFSYLPVEQIMYCLKDNKPLRDKVIKLVNFLPNVYESCVGGNVETLRYLIEEKHCTLSDQAITRAIQYGHLNVFKYLYSCRCLPLNRQFAILSLLNLHCDEQPELYKFYNQ